MDLLHIDSWQWKVALIFGLIALREFVRTVGGTAARYKNASSSRPMGVQTPPQDFAKTAVETIDSLAIAIGLVLFIIQPFLIQAFWIPSGSMEDTLRVGDRLLVSKLLYHLRDPEFQDVVVFQAPEIAIKVSQETPESGETDYIKRCIGTPGDIVYVLNGRVYREAKGQTQFVRLDEPYTKWSVDGPIQSYDMKIVAGKVYSREYRSPTITNGWSCEGKLVPLLRQNVISAATPTAVPPGDYLVFGDHRNNSNDSHAWGFVPRANMLGKALCVFWPLFPIDEKGKIENFSFHPNTIDRLSFYPRPRPPESSGSRTTPIESARY